MRIAGHSKDPAVLVQTIATLHERMLSATDDRQPSHLSEQAEWRVFGSLVGPYKIDGNVTHPGHETDIGTR